MENKKVFLDTNVILDFLNKERLGNKEASKLLYYLELNNYTIAISEDVLTNIFYIEKDKNRVLNFFKDIMLNEWMIYPFGLTVVKDAISQSLESNLDLEDVLQCLCAKENGCDLLITNDKKFYNCGIEIETVEKFLIDRVEVNPQIQREIT